METKELSVPLHLQRRHQTKGWKLLEQNIHH